MPERLSRAEGILDIEIRKPPIEQVIAQLYQNWKKEERKDTADI
nr:hypothetical protein [uncultured Acetatifactor sp.]